ncbi:hypothetical protein [Zavarzinia aquatilis]|uniref:Uncharacterized protein n=1 Tax=Zavarzinia aquatilis TaxID=2211142 RepID=A0A317EHQ9_9PROT|nr:hypothetical protein [Zavarzinia aquatilis]PWR24963.1 hypothetical protein DKG74_04125 [Zavarzinia aquatilis]
MSPPEVTLDLLACDLITLARNVAMTEQTVQQMMPGLASHAAHLVALNAAVAALAARLDVDLMAVARALPQRIPPEYPPEMVQVAQSHLVNMGETAMAIRRKG